MTVSRENSVALSRGLQDERGQTGTFGRQLRSYAMTHGAGPFGLAPLLRTWRL
jgi:hypothetical protein